MRARRAIAAGSVAAAMVGVAGCASATRPDGKLSVEPADFRRGPAPVKAPAPVAARPTVVTGPTLVTGAPARAADASAAPADAAPATTMPPITMAASSGGMTKDGVVAVAAGGAAVTAMDVSAYPGPPKLAETAPPPVGEEVMLDALIGQINGRPVYASEFLKSQNLEGRLLAIRGDREQWRKTARDTIMRALILKIRDELVLAEAIAGLKPEVRQEGLRQFMAQLRGDLVRRNAGSDALADERIRDALDMGLDDLAKERMNQQLVRMELERRALSRVYVSSRDVRQAYAQNYTRFNPPASARFRVISVPSSDSAGIEQVEQVLGSGGRFEDAAALPANGFTGEGAGLRTVQVPGEFAQTQFFGLPELNERARALHPGETVGPFEVGSSTYWLHLENVETPPGTSLYDAQLEIADGLRKQREEAERDRYFERLLRRGNFSDVRTMTDRLLEIATERYYGQPS